MSTKCNFTTNEYLDSLIESGMNFHTFLEKLKNKKYTEDQKLFKHRVLPGYLGGTYDPQNVIKISYEDHILIHYYRACEYGAEKAFGDVLAFQLMSGQTEESKIMIARAAGKLGGKKRAQLDKLIKRCMFDAAWQKEYGFKGAGLRNLLSGHMTKLNDFINKEMPDLRSRAGKIGGKVTSDMQRQKQEHFFDPQKRVQIKGNLTRYGLFINPKHYSDSMLPKWKDFLQPFENKYIKKEDIPQDIIDYCLENGVPNWGKRDKSIKEFERKKKENKNKKNNKAR